MSNFRCSRTPSGKVLETLDKTDREKTRICRGGATASFVPLGKRKGVKLYPTRDLRDLCWLFQKRLCEYGLAPKVFDRFEVDFRGSIRYAFITERAVIRQEITDKNDDFGNEALCNALAALGLHWVDRHSNNYGRLGKRTVVIDCDPRFFQAMVKDSPLFDLLPVEQQNCWKRF